MTIGWCHEVETMVVMVMEVLVVRWRCSGGGNDCHVGDGDSGDGRWG